jgi:hypothetical protein
MTDKGAEPLEEQENETGDTYDEIDRVHYTEGAGDA